MTKGYEIAAAIADKLAEPAFVELGQRLDANINWPRYLPVTKVGPTGVSDWWVLLPGGRRISLRDDEWKATVPMRVDGEEPKP